MSSGYVPQVGVTSPVIIGFDDSASNSTLVLRDAVGLGSCVAIATSAAGYLKNLGGLVLGAVTNKTSSFSTAAIETFYTCDTTGGSITAAPLTAVGNAGRVWIFVKTIAANSLIVDPAGSETVGGAATKTTTGQYSAIAIISDGTNFQVLWTLGTWT
jgi:hypothetical protein